MTTTYYEGTTAMVNNYAPQFPGRKLQTNICVYWKGNGRVWVEKIEGTVATVRPDCGEGTRSRARKVPVSQLDSEREWKFL